MKNLISIAILKRKFNIIFWKPSLILLGCASGSTMECATEAMKNMKKYSNFEEEFEHNLVEAFLDFARGASRYCTGHSAS